MIKIITQKFIDKTSRYLQEKQKQNIASRLDERALDSTCEYIEREMSTIKPQKSVEAVMDVAFEHIQLSGLYLEFNVFSGKSINYIASKTPQTVHGFDSFEGLPEFWRDGFDKGAFEVDALPKVHTNVMLHKGWFDNTLPQFINDHPERIALLHVDCDLYSSTKTIFTLLGDRIIKGTVIVFDEYFNYPMWQQGEFKAFQEFIQERGLSYRYLTYNSNHEQVAVIIE
ncbi:MAG: class I SAM-dependent methyltransferase [Ignavibacteria bacterium]|nr:class I SAM-dependent methyltransferase [Ignavibacteria bacterium]